jgi:hypothetical protein
LRAVLSDLQLSLSTTVQLEAVILDAVESDGTLARTPLHTTKCVEHLAFRAGSREDAFPVDAFEALLTEKLGLDFDTDTVRANSAEAGLTDLLEASDDLNTCLSVLHEPSGAVQIATDTESSIVFEACWAQLPLYPSHAYSGCIQGLPSSTDGDRGAG